MEHRLVLNRSAGWASAMQDLLHPAYAARSTGVKRRSNGSPIRNLNDNWEREQK